MDTRSVFVGVNEFSVRTDCTKVSWDFFCVSIGFSCYKLSEGRSFFWTYSPTSVTLYQETFRCPDFCSENKVKMGT